MENDKPTMKKSDLVFLGVVFGIIGGSVLYVADAIVPWTSALARVAEGSPDVLGLILFAAVITYVVKNI